MTLPLPLTLGFSAPASVLAARELLRRDCTNPERPLLVVVPTRDSIRVLREQLAIGAAQGSANGAFICPRIISAGQLAAGDSARVASPRLQQAALYCVLKREGARFPHLLSRASRASEGDYLAKAAQLRKLYATLCHEGININNPPARALAEADPLWRDILELYPLYCEELHRHRWLDEAEAAPLPLSPGTRIILACVPALPERARQQIEQSGHEVELWLHTDELHEGPQWFDAWGRPGSNWLAIPADDVLGLESPDWQQRFRVCGDLECMAEESARAAGRNRGEAVCVGVCDPGMESAVAEAFSHYGVATVRPRGIPFTASGWNRLFQLLTRQAELLEETGHAAHETAWLSAECASSLLHNPILTDGLGLTSPQQLALDADEIMRKNLPAALGTMCRLAAPALNKALNQLGRWLSTALASAEGLLSGLRELAAHQMEEGAPREQEETLALAALFTEQVDDACRELQESGWVKELSVLSALNLLASSGSSVAAPHPARALSLRGWLELSYAPEQQLVLAGLHDGIIPERWPASPYLTPRVIDALGLPTNEARAARDAYLLRSLYRCRSGRVQAIFSLLNARRDPLFPSSAFFRLTPQAHLAKLVGHFFDRRRPCPSSAQLPSDTSGWEYRSLNLPTDADDIARLASLSFQELGIANPMEGKKISPSALSLFLTCPLRFWLSKLNGMSDESVSPTQRDLDASDMGSCLHEVLRDFVSTYPGPDVFRATVPGAAEADEETLKSLLEGELDAAFTRSFEAQHGKPELLPRRFQHAAMRRRLRAYARLHLQLWQEGWEVARDAEGRPLLEYVVNWEMEGIPLHFIIDRIDCRLNPESGRMEYRVIDYKTGKVEGCYKNHLEALPLPEERIDLHLLDARLKPAVGPAGNTKHAHLRWKNLQLPLYTAWAQAYFAGHDVNSAYIRLGSTPEEVRLMAWGDSDKDPDYYAARFVPPSTHYPEGEEAEPLCENARRWLRFGLESIAGGKCFVSAEMMRWKPPTEHADLFGELLSLGSLDTLLLRFAPQPHKD